MGDRDWNISYSDGHVVAGLTREVARESVARARRESNPYTILKLWQDTYNKYLQTVIDHKAQDETLLTGDMRGSFMAHEVLFGDPIEVMCWADDGEELILWPENEEFKAKRERAKDYPELLFKINQEIYRKSKVRFLK